MVLYSSLKREPNLFLKSLRLESIQTQVSQLWMFLKNQKKNQSWLTFLKILFKKVGQYWLFEKKIRKISHVWLFKFFFQNSQYWQTFSILFWKKSIKNDLVMSGDLRKKPEENRHRAPLFGDLRFVLSHVLGTRESLRLKIRNVASIKNFCYITCWWQVLADNTNSVALLDLTQLQNISTTTTTKS